MSPLLRDHDLDRLGRIIGPDHDADPDTDRTPERDLDHDLAHDQKEPVMTGTTPASAPASAPTAAPTADRAADRVRAGVSEVLAPDRAGAPVSRLARVRQVAAFAAVVDVLVQVVVWLLVSVIGGHLDAPWWLWSVLGGAVVVGGLHLAVRNEEGRRTADPAVH